MRPVKTIMVCFSLWVCAWSFHEKMPFWYPIGTRKTLFTGKPEMVQFMGLPYVAYKKNDSQLVVHTDVCPHMGASFSKGGWVNDRQHLQCPYHGFEFDEGRFVAIPSSKKEQPLCIKNHKGLSTPPVLEKNGYYYLFPEDRDQSVLTTPYFPPEHDDPSFIAVHGHQVLDCPIDSLVENLLDMLHISYVHSFGNMDMPLARNIQYTDLGEYAGKTSFSYSPNPNTISKRVGNTDVVHVENEFYLPTTTLTRVRAGDVIKTVFTQSLPMGKNKTILFWTVYRNFWKDPNIPMFTVLGDWVLSFLMKRTIQEDASILSRCYPDKRKGFLTKYDITIRKYRNKCEPFRTDTE